jgi:ABC-type glycerol-3-phosphate transport system substrate-binding protein
MGAEMYDDTGYLSNLDTLEVIEAIEFMTKLFTIYNLPQQVAIFFEHFRSGTLPAGLASIDFYLQLKYACPELTGQWKVLPIPGMYSEELQEVARWTTTYGKCSIMFKDSDKKSEGWEFLKWFHSTEVQSLYLNQVKMILGEKYLFVPANMQSLADSPWDEEIKTQIVAQAKWSRIPAIIPGSYVVEREISNIWNKVVIDKMNVRVAINQSIPKINRELKRKFEEFGYLKDGQPVKQYLVPKLDNLDRWVKGYRYEEK